MFVASIVIAIVIYKAPEDKFLRVDPTLVNRDLYFYIVSAIVVFIFGFTGYVYVWSAATMLLIYVVLVTTVVYQDSGKKNADALLSEENADFEEEEKPEYKIDYSMFDLKTAKGRLKLALYKMVYHSEFTNLPTYEKKKIFGLREKTRDLNVKKKTLEMQNVNRGDITKAPA